MSANESGIKDLRKSNIIALNVIDVSESEGEKEETPIPCNVAPKKRSLSKEFQEASSSHLLANEPQRKRARKQTNITQYFLENDSLKSNQ